MVRMSIFLLVFGCGVVCNAAPAPVEEIAEGATATPLLNPDGNDDCAALVQGRGGVENACRAVANAGGPQAGRAHSALAVLAMRKGDLAIARQHIEAALSATPMDGSIINNYANLLLLEKNYPEALRNYDNALNDTRLNNFDVAAIHLNRALCLRGMGRYDASKDAFSAYQRWLQTPGAQVPGA